VANTHYMDETNYKIILLDYQGYIVNNSKVKAQGNFNTKY